jgi:magnesium transporter
MKLESIDTLVLEDIQNPNHPSEFIVMDDYAVLIIRIPEVGEEKVEVISNAFVIEKNEISIYNRKNTSLEKLGDYKTLISFIDKKIDKLIKDIQRYHYDIELLEESLYEENVTDMFMQEWLRYKKDVSLIYRVMFHTSLAFDMFLDYAKKVDKDSILDLQDILEHINRIKNLSTSAKEKLDNLYDFYRAKVDEKMNKNVYYLTIISGIFLPLTLITGFFGMNTGGLPFVDDTNGTLKAVLISLVLEVLLIVPFFMMNSKKIKKFKREI